MLKDRKGFFFVVTSLVLLLYIMTNLALWSETVSIQEERYSENFKISNIDYAASQINEEVMVGFARIAANYALFKLNNHSIEHPVSPGADWVYENINYSMFGLLTEGYAEGSYFEDATELTYSDDEKGPYTFYGVFGTINESLQKIDMELSPPTVTNFNFNQSSINSVEFSFVLSFNVSDVSSNSASLKKEIPVAFNLSIEGLIDPSVSRELLKDEYGNQVVEKQIFFNQNPDFDPNEDLELEAHASSSDEGEGWGWFYGYVHRAGEEAPQEQFKFLYAIVGTEDEIESEDNYASYGAYIVISDENITTVALGGMDSKPVFIYNAEPAFSSCDGKECFFFVSEYDPDSSEVNSGSTPEVMYFNIENFRDFIVCGYYFPTNLVDGYEGPSYFQKLLVDSYSLSDEEYGMATFLVWQGIEGGYASDGNSRLDLEFFGDGDGTRIRGMPGCKSIQMCSSVESYIGQFKLSDDAFSKFLTDSDPDDVPVQCDNSWSDCGDVG